MSSILTNMSAMSAVASLTATQKALATTQNQISTGLKVSTASDNGAYWSIATGMRSDVGALGAVSDSLNLGTSVVSVAAQAISSSIDVLNQMKDQVLTAQTAGVDQGTIDTQLKQLQIQLRAYANSATFNGVNLLTYTSTTNVVTSFSRDTQDNVSVGVTDVALSSSLYGGVGTQGGTTTGGVLDSIPTTAFTLADGTTGTATQSIDDLTTSGMSADALQTESAQIDAAITKLTSFASTLGSTQTNLASQGTFTSTLSDSITTGVGSLVDADMNEASTRLNALQTQQQLGIQSLSIANANSQLILKLFQ